MSWLYDHRDQLDGYRRYAEIAYHFRYRVPPAEMDDIEQEITIKLKAVAGKKDCPTNNYLYAVARNIVNTYWRNKYRERGRSCPLYEGNGGVMFAKRRKIAPTMPDMDARLDAKAMLDTLPEKLVDLGRRILAGEHLNGPDRKYLCLQRHSMSKHIRADAEKIERMRRLYVDEGLSCAEVGRKVGKTKHGVRYHLNKMGVIRH